jgi:hypothetical protein
MHLPVLTDNVRQLAAHNSPRFLLSRVKRLIDVSMRVPMAPLSNIDRGAVH